MSRFKDGTFILIDKDDDKHTSLICKQFKYDDNDGKVKDVKESIERIRTSDISELKKTWSLMKKLLLRSNEISFAERINVEIGKIEDISESLNHYVISMVQCKRNKDSGLPLRSKEQQSQEVKKFVSRKENFFVSAGVSSVFMENGTICTLDQDFLDYQMYLRKKTFEQKGKIYYSLDDLQNLSNGSCYSIEDYEKLLIIYRKIMLNDLSILDVNDIYVLLKCLYRGCSSPMIYDGGRTTSLIKKYAI